MEETEINYESMEVPFLASFKIVIYFMTTWESTCLTQKLN